MRPQRFLRKASIAVLALAYFGLAPGAGAAAANSPQVNVSVSTLASNQTTASLTFTTSSNGDPLLLVQVAIHGAGGVAAPAPSVSSVTYGSSRLTPLLGEPSRAALSSVRDEVWYLANPAPESARLTATLSSAANVCMVASEVDGVKEQKPFRAAAWSAGSGTAALVAAPAWKDTLVIDALAVAGSGVDSSTLLPATAQTLFLADSTGSGVEDIIGASSGQYATEHDPKLTTAMSWAWSTPSTWVQIAVDLR